MKNYPLGVQTFNEIIERNLLYIDKTEEIYNLLKGKNYLKDFGLKINGIGQIHIR